MLVTGKRFDFLDRRVDDPLYRFACIESTVRCCDDVSRSSDHLIDQERFEGVVLLVNTSDQLSLFADGRFFGQDMAR